MLTEALINETTEVGLEISEKKIKFLVIGRRQRASS